MASIVLERPLPCSFCGSKAAIYLIQRLNIDLNPGLSDKELPSESHYALGCCNKECDNSQLTDWKPTVGAAISAWNKRMEE